MRPFIIAASIAVGAHAAEGATILLHYDYMVKEGANGHSHEPDPRAIAIVVDAFRRRGVTLHIDPVHEAIPERTVVTTDEWTDPACNGPSAVTLSALREQYVHPQNPRVHYAVFGHRAVCPDIAHCFQCHSAAIGGGKPDATSTGIADLPGWNFAVTLGPYFDSGDTFLLALEAATFMHELGHNLNLWHGGAEGDLYNWKPNYMSVMNYAYQYNGIVQAPAPGSTSFVTCQTDGDCNAASFCEPRLEPLLGANICTRVDYSDRELPPLREFVFNGLLGLDENAGVSGPPDDVDIVMYFAAGPVQLLGPSFGPIDWNNDGSATGEHVEADIDNDGQYSLLRGFDDWTAVREYIATPEYHAGIPRRRPSSAVCARGH
jgi:hypothetical protein